MTMTENDPEELDLNQFIANMNVGNRVKLATYANPNMAGNPGAAMALANDPTLSDDDLITTSRQMYGIEAADKLEASMKRLSPSAQRMMYGQLSPVQQQSLQTIGYKPPERDDGGWGFLDPIAKVGGAALGGMYAPIRPVAEPVFDGLMWLGDRGPHLYRTVRTMSTTDQMQAVVGGLVGGAAVLAALPTGGSSLVAAGALGFGALAGANIAAGATNPDDWFRAFTGSYRGERTFKLDAQERADELLGDPKLLGMASTMAVAGIDTSMLARELASTQSPGGPDVLSAQLPKVIDIVSKIAPQGTPEYEQLLIGVLGVVAEPLFQQAVDELRRGKISMGRDVAGAFGLEYGSTEYNLVSGTIDGISQIVLDPTLALGWAHKAVRMSRAGITSAQMADIGQDMSIGLARFDEIQRKNRGVRQLHELFVESVNTNNYTRIARINPSMARMFESFRAAAPELGKQVGELTLDDFNKFIHAQTKLAPILQGMGTIRGVKGGIILDSYGPLRESTRFVTGAIRSFTYGITDIRFEENVAAILASPEAKAFRENLSDYFKGMIDEKGLVQNHWKYNEAHQGARAIGRFVGDLPVVGRYGAQPIADVATRITTMMPRRGMAMLVGDEAPQDLRALTEMAMQTGMPEHMRRRYLDDILQSNNPGVRANAVASFMDDMLTLGGLRASDETAVLADEMIGRVLHAYGNTDITKVTLRSGREVNVALFPQDMAVAIPVPDLFELRKIVEQSKWATFLGGVDDSYVQSLMVNVWKPAVIMRFGFIFRAAGEEMFNFMLRGGIGSIVQTFGADAVAQHRFYNEARQRLIDVKGVVSKLTEEEQLILAKGPTVAHLRPLANKLAQWDWGRPIVTMMKGYSDFLTHAIETGLFPKYKLPELKPFEKGLALQERALTNFTGNLNALVFGSEHSWRRMAIGGVADDVLEPAYEFERQYGTTVMREVGSITAGPLDRTWDKEQIERTWLQDDKGRYRTVEFAIDRSRYRRISMSEPGATRVKQRNMQKFTEQPEIARVVQRHVSGVLPPRLLAAETADVVEQYQSLGDELQQLILAFGDGRPNREMVAALIDRMEIPPSLKRLLLDNVPTAGMNSIDDYLDAIADWTSRKGAGFGGPYADSLRAQVDQARTLARQFDDYTITERAALTQLLHNSLDETGAIRIRPNEIREQFSPPTAEFPIEPPKSVVTRGVKFENQFAILPDGTLRLYGQPQGQWGAPQANMSRLETQSGLAISFGRHENHSTSYALDSKGHPGIHLEIDEQAVLDQMPEPVVKPVRGLSGDGELPPGAYRWVDGTNEMVVYLSQLGDASHVKTSKALAAWLYESPYRADVPYVLDELKTMMAPIKDPAIKAKLDEYAQAMVRKRDVPSGPAGEGARAAIDAELAQLSDEIDALLPASEAYNGGYIDIPYGKWRGSVPADDRTLIDLEINKLEEQLRAARNNSAAPDEMGIDVDYWMEQERALTEQLAEMKARRELYAAQPEDWDDPFARARSQAEALVNGISNASDEQLIEAVLAGTVGKLAGTDVARIMELTESRWAKSANQLAIEELATRRGVAPGVVVDELLAKQADADIWEAVSARRADININKAQYQGESGGGFEFDGPEVNALGHQYYPAMSQYGSWEPNPNYVELGPEPKRPVGDPVYGPSEAELQAWDAEVQAWRERRDAEMFGGDNTLDKEIFVPSPDQSLLAGFNDADVDEFAEFGPGLPGTFEMQSTDQYRLNPLTISGTYNEILEELVELNRYSSDFMLVANPPGGNSNPLEWIDHVRKANTNGSWGTMIGSMPSPKVLHGSLDDVEELLRRDLASAIQSPHANGWSLSSQRTDAAGNMATRSDQTARVFVLPPPVERIMEVSYEGVIDNLIASSPRGELIAEHRDVARAWLAGKDNMAVADLELAKAIAASPMASSIGVREMVVPRSNIEARIGDGNRLQPAVVRKRPRADDQAIAWNIQNFDENDDMLRGLDDLEVNRADEWAQAFIQQLRTEVTRGTQEVWVPRARRLDAPRVIDNGDGTTTTIDRETMVYRGKPAEDNRVAPDEEIDSPLTPFYDKDGNLVRPSDPNGALYFEQKVKDLGAEGEIMWEAFGPMLQDSLDARNGRMMFRKKEAVVLHASQLDGIDVNDIVPVYRSRPEHLDDIPGLQRNTMMAYGPTLNAQKPQSLWNKVVEFGFDRVIGPSIDALARKPMAMHFFRERYNAAKAVSKWRIDPTVEANVMEVVNRHLQHVDPTEMNETFQAVRKIARFQGEDHAMSWTNAQASAWLRGHTSDELVESIRRAEQVAGQRARTATKGSEAYQRAVEAEVAAAQLRKKTPDVLVATVDPATDMEGFVAMIQARLKVREIPTYDEILKYHQTAIWGKNEYRSGELLEKPPLSGDELLQKFDENDWAAIRAADVNLRHIQEEAGQFAAIAAINDMMPFLDSHELRTQFAEVAKPLLPFWYAEENFLKRWARTIALDPTAIRKAQLGIMGLKNAGVIKEDANGRGWFVYPGGGIFASLLDWVPGLDRVPVEVLFQTPVSEMMPGVNTRFGTPAFAPFVTAPVGLLSMGFPEIEPLDRMLAGDYASTQSPLKQFIPAYAVNTVQAIMGVDTQRLLSAQMAAMAQLEINDRGLPKEADAGQMDEYLRTIREHARIITLSQALLGYFTPGSPSTMVTNESSIAGIGDVNPKQMLSQTFITLVQELGIEQGTAQYLKLYPLHGLKDVINPMAATEGQSFSSSGAPLPPTEEALVFYQENRRYMGEFPDAGPWLLPQSNDPGSRSQYAMDQQTILGLRQGRTPEEFLRAMKFKEASGEYFKEQARYEDAVAEARAVGDKDVVREITDIWDAWSNDYRTAHPVFNEELMYGGGAERRQNVITQMMTIVNDPAAPSPPHMEQLRMLTNEFTRYRLELQKWAPDQTADGRAMKETIKKMWTDWAEGFVQMYPAMESYWLSVIRPESRLD